MKKIIESELREGILTKEKILCECVGTIEKIAESLTQALQTGHKILLCGNGGSAADAQHFAAELVGRFCRERKALPAIALSTDTSILTCVGNDYGYDRIFSRQVEALGQPGDVLLAITTSGNSSNVLSAVIAARAKAMKTIALTGRGGGKIASQADLVLVIPSSSTARIQEGHISVVHVLCALIEHALFNKETKERVVVFT